MTFRNNAGQTALPIRSWGSFMPPNGVGGGGVHWNAETWRFLPTDFQLRSHLTERYGKNFLPEDMTIQDWGVTYDELEPYYDRFEYLCGTSGKAGNIKGAKQAGGNPVRRARVARVSDAAAEAALWADAVRARRRRRWVISPSRSPPAICRRPTPTRSASRSAPAPIAASANGSAAATTRRRARRPRSCRCWCGARISRRARNARCCRSISTPRASAPPASPMSTAAARNGSSRPSSCCSAPSSSSTCSCCCCRASASPTIRRPARA